MTRIATRASVPTLHEGKKQDARTRLPKHMRATPLARRYAPPRVLERLRYARACRLLCVHEARSGGVMQELPPPAATAT